MTTTPPCPVLMEILLDETRYCAPAIALLSSSPSTTRKNGLIFRMNASKLQTGAITRRAGQTSQTLPTAYIIKFQRGWRVRRDLHDRTGKIVLDRLPPLQTVDALDRLKSTPIAVYAHVRKSFQPCSCVRTLVPKSSDRAGPLNRGLINCPCASIYISAQKDPKGCGFNSTYYRQHDGKNKCFSVHFIAPVRKPCSR